MKGVILSRAPHATVVDITHTVPRHDVAAGAFALATAARHFPPGTIHVAVVDPGVGSTRAAVILESDGQIFVGPDNGLFRLAAPEPTGVYAISAAEFCLSEQSATFHGRDVFAAAAGRLAAGVEPAKAGPAISLTGRLAAVGAELVGGQGTAANVVHTDSFGNLITDLPAAALPPQPSMVIAQRHIEQLSTTYQSVDVGELVAYIGSGNTLEIAVREGSAAELLRVGRGAIVYVRGRAAARGDD